MEFSIESGARPRRQKTVLYGQHGIGKTTMAARWPGAVLIDLEDGSGNYDVRRMTRPTTWLELLQAVGWAARNLGDGETVVVDSLDCAERLCERHVLAQKNMESIEGFGYGAGYKYLVDEYQRLLRGLDMCIEAGVHVVCVAHDQVAAVTLPDNATGYTVYGLKLHKRTAAVVKEWADAVIYCHYTTSVIRDAGKQTGHAVGGTERVMQMSHTAIIDAKNRWGVDGELPMGYESVKPYIED